tara:strand:+ start:284 stop:619 length:336 start_codon:yes stop_codon:yes gene_type:complete
MNDYKKIYQGFCDDTKTTFYVNTFAILLIFLFLLGPMKTSGFMGYIIRVVIILLFSYSVYINVISSNSLLNIENIFFNSDLAIVRNNFILNILYIILLVIFIFYLFSGFLY